MKIKLFHLQKNKRFNYTPRYYEGKEQGNAFEMGSRIRRDRETVTNHFTEEWRAIRNESRNKKKCRYKQNLLDCTSNTNTYHSLFP